ncbi:hypothetical protein ABG067_005411 [Albugo candida]
MVVIDESDGEEDIDEGNSDPEDAAAADIDRRPDFRPSDDVAAETFRMFNSMIQELEEDIIEEANNFQDEKEEQDQEVNNDIIAGGRRAPSPEDLSFENVHPCDDCKLKFQILNLLEFQDKDFDDDGTMVTVFLLLNMEETESLRETEYIKKIYQLIAYDIYITYAVDRC